MNKDIYYANDKDIFDAICSKKLIYTTSNVRTLCRERNTFVSEKDDRETIIDYFATLPHSVRDLIKIRETVRANTKSEKISSTKLNGTIDDNNTIFEMLDEIKEDRSNKYNESFTVISSNPDHIVVDVSYTDIDYSNTRLRQKQERSARIEIEKNKEGNILIRKPANERAESITDDIINRLNEKNEDSLTKKIIDLSSVKNPKLRTKFFIELIKNIGSINLKEVNSIHINSYDDEVVDDEEKDETKQNVLAKLQTAIFNGENLLETPEYLDFEEKGFYITGIKWQAFWGQKREICVLEASFRDAKECKNFVYDIKGIYQKNKDDTYQKSIKPLEGIQKTELLRNLEETSLKVFDDILNEYNVQIGVN